ncbi:MAG: sensor histidine kinase, partial [Steroidobacteraceae bacterium]
MDVHLDWRQAERFGIRESDIAPDTIVHFKQPTFWEAYRNEALFVAGVIALQGALIAALLVERRRRRQTSSALDASEGRMSLALRAAGLSLWTWHATRDGPGSDFDAVHPADRAELERALREALGKDEDLSVEYRVLRHDGAVRWIAAYGRAEQGRAGRLLGVARDITERRDAELQAERDRSALRHLARVSMLGQLSASIAHQLNQPLAAILGNAEAASTILAREPVDLAELREICDDIAAEDQRAAEIIKRLGALFRHGDLRFSPLDLNDLVRETLELARTDLLMRHVTPVIGLASSLPAINGDRVQLQQVLLNLIVNAADAMSSTQETERVLTIRTEASGGDVRVSVGDRGPGISHDHLKTVFEPFWTT